MLDMLHGILKLAWTQHSTKFSNHIDHIFMTLAEVDDTTDVLGI